MAERYEPNTWIEGASLPVLRTANISAEVDGKIYMIAGGFYSSTAMNTVHIYCSATDTWTTGAPMPGPLYSMNFAVVDKKIYCMGGRKNPPNSVAATEHRYASLQIYDTVADLWIQGESMGTARARGACVVANGQIYYLGGEKGRKEITQNNELTNVVEIYDPETDSWRRGPNMPLAKTWPNCYLYNNKIYCIGGYLINGATGSVEILDLSTEQWSYGPSMPTIRNNPTFLMHEHCIYCIGGSGATQPIDVFDMDTGTWKTMDNNIPLEACIDNPCVAIGNKIYCLGRGKETGSSVTWNNLQVYDIATDSWSIGANAPNDRYTPFDCFVVNNSIYCMNGLKGNNSPRTLPVDIYILGESIPIHLQFLDKEGEPLLPEGNAVVTVGGNYTANAPNINEYVCIGHQVDGGNWEQSARVQLESVQSPHTVTFVYQPANVSVTERHQTLEGLQLQPDVVNVVETGMDYEQTAPRLEGYKRVGHIVDGGEISPLRTVQILDVQQNHTITFLYEPCDGEHCIDPDEPLITERYLDVESGTYIQPNTTRVVEPGENYMQVAPRIEGYKRIGHKVDGGEMREARTAVIADVQTDHVVDFLYQPCDGEECVDPDDITIIEKYFDVENERYISPDTFAFVPEGGSYRKTAPVKGGYARVGHQVDNGEADSSFTAFIEAVQESHVVIFLYEPGEDSGGGGTGPGDGHGCNCGCGGGDNCQCGNDCACGGSGGGTGPGGGSGPGDGGGGTGPGDGGGDGPGDGGGTGPGDGGGGTGPGDGGGGTSPGDGGGGTGPGDGGGGTDPGDGGGDGPGDGGDDKIKITERYYDVTNDKYIRPDTQSSVTKGGQYSKTAPVISGYFRLGHRIDNGTANSSLTASIQSVQEQHIVTFLYEPAIDCDDFVIRERYFDVTNERYIRPDTETLVEPGADYRGTAPELAGYERVGHRIDDGADSNSLTAVIENVRSDHTVTFLYLPEGGGNGECDELVIRERYYDVASREYIRPDTETLVEPGGDYSKTAPRLIGYDRIGHRIDDGGESEILTAVIYEVREDHVATFLYLPEKDDGNGGGCPDPEPGDGCDQDKRCKCGCCPCCCEKYTVRLTATVSTCDEEATKRLLKFLKGER